jgi:ATP-dependent protease ClpP protease subunit
MNKIIDLQSLHEFGIDIEGRAIYFGQEDGVDSSVDYKSCLKFVKNLDILNSLSSKLITVKMISCEGGVWDHCLAICGAIQRSKSPVNIVASGFTASSGTVILQMAKVRYICGFSGFMVHCGSLAYDGHSISAESAADYSKQEYRKMLNIYASRCINGQFFKDRKYSLSRVKTYIDTKMKTKGDWYLKDVEEVIFYGFADVIV